MNTLKEDHDFFEQNTKGHEWQLNSDGEIDRVWLDEWPLCSGPLCKHCGYRICFVCGNRNNMESCTACSNPITVKE